MYREIYEPMKELALKVLEKLKQDNERTMYVEDRDSLVKVLTANQGLAIELGEYLEYYIGDKYSIISSLEEYCEGLYQISLVELDPDQMINNLNRLNEILNVIKEKIVDDIQVSDDRLSLVAIVKNEEPYIEEWIEYHKMQGVTRFYIFDNESNDGLYEKLKPYIISGEIVYKYYPGKKKQNRAYNEAILNYRFDTKYMGFIDIDEFIVPTAGKTLLDILDEVIKEEDGIGGIAINWRVYGSSGYVEKPEGSVTKNYIFRAEDEFEQNRYIKTIANPRVIEAFLNPHIPMFADGFVEIDEDNRIINGLLNPYGSCGQKIRINHYFTKSKEEFKAKCARGKADMLDFYEIEEEFIKNDKNEIFDSVLQDCFEI